MNISTPMEFFPSPPKLIMIFFWKIADDVPFFMANTPLNLSFVAKYFFDSFS